MTTEILKGTTWYSSDSTYRTVRERKRMWQKSCSESAQANIQERRQPLRALIFSFLSTYVAIVHHELFI